MITDKVEKVTQSSNAGCLFSVFNNEKVSKFTGTNLISNHLLLQQYRGFLVVILIMASFQGWTQSLTRFVENKGQWPDQVAFKAMLYDRSVFIHQNRFTYVLMGEAPLPDVGPHGYSDSSKMVIDLYSVQTIFIGGNAEQVKGLKVRPTKYNYYLGEPRYWAEEVREYETVKLEALYPGIDVETYVKHEKFKYDFVIEPGADPHQIAWKYAGAEQVRIEQGKLVISTSIDPLYELKPVAYQTINGRRINVPCAFTLKDGIAGFDLPAGYDSTQVLVIDPTVIFSRYAGATSDNFGYTATFDRDGFLFSGNSVFGWMYGVNSFPTTIGAYQVNFGGGSATFNGGTDIGLTKYDTTGSFMVYATLIGGLGDELPHSLITDEFGQLYMMGTSSSPDYPVTPTAYDTTFGGGTALNMLQGLAVYYQFGSDIVVSKFSADGGTLEASSFVGGSEVDGLNWSAVTKYNYADEVRGEIMLDEQNNIIVASSTWSDDFPTVNAIQDTSGGLQDGVLFQLDNGLQTLLWSTYLGGDQTDAAYSIKLKGDDQLVVGGGTNSDSLHFIKNGLMTNRPGGRADGFVVVMNRDNYSAEYGSYFGSDSAYDQIYLLDVDNDEMIHVFGQTEGPSQDFIVNAAFNNPNSGQFITKFNPTLDTIVWSTLFGSGSGVPDISPSAFLVDVCSKIYLSGWGGEVNDHPWYINNAGYTINMPVTADAFSTTTVDSSDFYLFVLEDDASTMVYGSYYGSPTAAEHVDGGTSRFDKKGRIYQSVCAGCRQDQGFPLIPPTFALDSQYLNNSWNCNNGTFKMDFQYPQLIADFRYTFAPCSGEVEFSERSKTFENTLFTWEFGDGTTSNEPNPTHVYAESGEYVVKLKVEDITSCNLADSLTRTVVIASNDPVLLDTVYYCAGQEVQLGFTPQPGFTYQWTPADDLSNPNIANPIYTGDSMLTMTVVVTGDGCTTTYDIPISRIMPSASSNNYIPACPAMCNASATLIGAQGVAPYAYVWDNGTTLATGTNLCPGTHSYTVTDATGCVYVDVVTVNESDIDLTPPEVNADVDSLALGEVVSLNGVPNSNDQVRWIRDGEVLDETNSLVDNPAESGWYTFEVFDEENPACSTADSIFIKVLPFECGYPYIFVPNAFSPNGDGENDILYVRGRNIESIFFAVYNRWGEQVFVTEDINLGWDGNYKGMKADPMVFDYYLRITCVGALEPEILKGNVTLLR